jgi:hypothetical protein
LLCLVLQARNPPLSSYCPINKNDLYAILTPCYLDVIDLLTHPPHSVIFFVTHCKRENKWQSQNTIGKRLSFTT